MSELERNFKIPESFQEQTARMTTFVDVDLAIPDAPTPTGELVDDDKHRELQKVALQILFLPTFHVSDHIFRKGADPSNTDEGFPAIRCGNIEGHNFELALTNNFNNRQVSAFMSLNGIYHVAVTKWGDRNSRDELRLDTATAEWFQRNVLEPVRFELMGLKFGQNS